MNQYVLLDSPQERKKKSASNKNKKKKSARGSEEKKSRRSKALGHTFDDGPSLIDIEPPPPPPPAPPLPTAKGDTTFCCVAGGKSAGYLSPSVARLAMIECINIDIRLRSRSSCTTQEQISVPRPPQESKHKCENRNDESAERCFHSEGQPTNQRGWISLLSPASFFLCLLGDFCFS